MPAFRKTKRRLASGLKWLKGIGALALLLALPTYSYLDHSARQGAAEGGIGFARQASQESPNGSEREVMEWQGATRPSGRGEGSEITAAPKPTQSVNIGSRAAAGLIPEGLRGFPVGVPSSVTSAGFVRRGQGRPFSLDSPAAAAGLESLGVAESEAAGRMVARATRASGIENPFLAALQDREASDQTAVAGDIEPAPIDDASPEQVAAPPTEEAPEPADQGGDEAAPVEDQKERRDDEAPDSSQDSGNDEKPSDEPSSDDGSPDPEQDPNADPSAPPSSSYNFLVIPKPDPLDEGRRVFLARRDEADEERFNLEDGTAFIFPQSLVLSAVGLEAHHQFATSDLNVDRLLDLVLVENLAAFCSLNVFLQDPSLPGGFDQIGVQLPERSVKSFALLDFDLDDLLDLAVLFEGDSHLSIFRLDMQEKALRLLEERPLPFKPALVIDWQFIHTGGWQERILYILDESFGQAAAASSFDPGRIVQVPQVPPYRSLRVTWPSEAGPVDTEVLVFESDDRIAMLEAGRSGYRLYAWFDTSFYSPVAVMGDFQGNGARQLLVLP